MGVDMEKKSPFETFDSAGGPIQKQSGKEMAHNDSSSRPDVTKGPKEDIQRTDGKDASG